jgi:hypothetical protein
MYTKMFKSILGFCCDYRGVGTSQDPGLCVFYTTSPVRIYEYSGLLSALYMAFYDPSAALLLFTGPPKTQNSSRSIIIQIFLYVDYAGGRHGARMS